MSGRGKAELLLIEDNPGDVRLAYETFCQAKINVVSDGEEALVYLRRIAIYDRTKLPDLIMLDLNLPKTAGHEVLAQIKSDPTLRRIPVIVLSSSETEEDILKAYDLHANCYITKPHDLDEFVRIVSLIEEFWWGTIKLPGGESNVR